MSPDLRHDLSRDLSALRTAFDALAAPINRALEAAGHAPVTVDLLGERAALMALSPPARISANGRCRLLRARDGWVALNIVRPDDEILLPAWLETEHLIPDADAIAAAVGEGAAGHWVERGVLLGLAVSRLGEAEQAPALRTLRLSRPRRHQRPIRVVDLSSLWAGPLCGHLLHRLGAEATKVESRSRPDGGRVGSPAFFSRLNVGKTCHTIDFADPADVAALRALILDADVVIEASRPRALRQFGLDAETLLPLAPGLVWLSITAHGREGERGNRIGYGDDAAVAGGLVGRDPSGAPRFFADAVADPLTGVHAAGAVIDALAEGGGVLLDMSLAGVAAEAARVLRATVSGSLAA